MLYANRTSSSRLLSCSLSSEVLNFIFDPLVAVSPVHRVARQVADIFSVILHSRPLRRSFLAARKKKEWIDDACNFIRCRQHFRATTIPRLSIIEMILFPRRKYREEYLMALNNIAKIAPRKKIFLKLIIGSVYIHVSTSSIKQNVFDAWRKKILSHIFAHLLHGNDSFAVPKNLARYKSENIFVIDH